MPFTPPPPESGVAPDDQAFAPPSPDSGVPASDQPWYQRLGTFIQSPDFQRALASPSLGIPGQPQLPATSPEALQTSQTLRRGALTGIERGSEAVPAALADVGTGQFVNVPQALRGETPEYRAIYEQPYQHPALRVGGTASADVLSMAPKIAATVGAGAVGGPAAGEVTGAGLFGFNKNLEYDPFQLGIAVGLPLVGKAAGGLAGNIASKLGVTSEVAKGLIKSGSAYGISTALLTAAALPGWSKLTQQEKEERAAGVIANAFLGVTSLDPSTWGKTADEAESKWKESGQPGDADKTKAEFKRTRKEGPSPEWRVFWQGAKPEDAGTTIDKVQDYAKSIGRTWTPPLTEEEMYGPKTPTGPVAPQPATPAAPAAPVPTPTSGVALSPGLEAIAQKVADPKSGQLTPDENAIISSITPQQRKIYLARVDALRKGGEQNATKEGQVQGNVPSQPSGTTPLGVSPETSTGNIVQPTAPIQGTPETQVTAPEVPGVRFDKVVPGASGKPQRWTYTIQDNGPAHNAQISIETGSTPEQVQDKVKDKVAEYLGVTVKREEAAGMSTAGLSEQDLEGMREAGLLGGIEWTDRNPGSPTEGLSLHFKANETPAQMSQRWAEKAAAHIAARTAAGQPVPRHKFLTDIWGDKEPTSKKETGWKLGTENLKANGIDPVKADADIAKALAEGADPKAIEKIIRSKQNAANTLQSIRTMVPRRGPAGAPLQNIPTPAQVKPYDPANPRGLGTPRPARAALVNDPVISQHVKALAARGNPTTTIKKYTNDLNDFHNWHLAEYGNVPDWKSLTPENLRSYLRYLSLKKFARPTIEGRFTALKSLLSTLGNKSAENIQLPELGKKLPMWMSIPEVNKLLDAPIAYWSTAPGRPELKAAREITGIRDKAILEVLYGSGLRVSELTNLKAGDIDFNNQEISVVGKGSKKRKVPTTKTALDSIRAYWQKSNLTPGPNDPVFISGRGRINAINSETVESNLKHYLKHAGLDIHITPHTLRHSFATHMLDAGAGLREIQEMLGHEDIETTGKYLHVTPERLKESHAKAFGTPEPPNPPVSTPPTNPQITPDFEGPGTAAPAGFTPKDPQIKQLADSVSTLVASNPGKPELREGFTLGDRLSRAKERWLRALTGLRGAGLASLDALRGKPIITTWKNALGNHDVAMTESTLNNKDYRTQMTKAVPKMDRRGGISVRLGVGDDQALMDLMEQQAPARYKKYFTAARNLTPEELVIVENHRNYFDARLDEAHDAGLMVAFVDNYLHRIYPNDERFIDKIINELGSGIYTGQPGLAKNRIYRTDLDAMLAGLDPEMDFTIRTAAYDHALNKAIADRKLIKDFWEITMPDGRPMVDVGGKADEVIGEEGDAESLLVKPHWKRTDADNPLNNRSDYKVVNWAPLRGWRWVDTDANGKKTLVQGDVLVHKDAVRRIENLFKPSSVRQFKPGGVPLGRAALGLSTTIKQIAFDLSLFHPVQLTVHGGEHRVFEPYFQWMATGLGMETTKIDMKDPITRGLVQHGLMLVDHNNLQMFQEGLAGSLFTRFLPFGIGRLAQAYQYGLFHDWIPRLKLKMAKHAFERNKDNFPELTQGELMELTANQANSAFGELNWRRMGISRTMQDMMRLALIAPDFTLARGKYAAQALQTLIPREIPGTPITTTTPTGSRTTTPISFGFGFGREQAVAMIFFGALLNYVLARILNKWFNGVYHWEPSNAFSVINKGKAYSLRTAHGDLLHLATDSAGFWYNRLNPFFGASVIEYLTKRDQFGRTRTNMEQLQDLSTRAGVPISLRGFLHPREQSLWESFANMMGITNHRSTSIDNIYRLAENFKKANDIAEPAERIYNADRDPYRGIKLAALYRSPEEVAVEIDRAFKARQSDPERLRAHFKEYATRPFSGSKKLEENFYNQLSEDEKGIYKEAWQERLKMIDNLEKGGELYERMKRGQPPGEKFIPPPAESGVPP